MRWDELLDAGSIIEQADALVDAIYYLCDCAVKHGLNLDPLFEIVHRANMEKLVDGKAMKDNRGKVLKPEGWVAPDEDLQLELERQQLDGSWANGSVK